MATVQLNVDVRERLAVLQKGGVEAYWRRESDSESGAALEVNKVVEMLLDSRDDQFMFCFSWKVCKLMSILITLVTVSLIATVVIYALYFPAITSAGQLTTRDALRPYLDEVRKHWTGHPDDFRESDLLSNDVARVMFVGDPQIEGSDRINKEGLYGTLTMPGIGIALLPIHTCAVQRHTLSLSILAKHTQCTTYITCGTTKAYRVQVLCTLSALGRRQARCTPLSHRAVIALSRSPYTPTHSHA